MKLFTTAIAFIFLLASCSSTKKTTSGTSSGTGSPVTTASSSTTSTTSAAKDGSSYETAIVIKEKNESTGVAAEYKWLKANYPGYTLSRQSLQHKNGKSYDVMDIVTKDGEEKKIYFDITGFFGKF